MAIVNFYESNSIFSGPRKPQNRGDQWIRGNMQEAWAEFFEDRDARDARSRSREARVRSRSPEQESNNFVLLI